MLSFRLSDSFLFLVPKMRFKTDKYLVSLYSSRVETIRPFPFDSRGWIYHGKQSGNTPDTLRSSVSLPAVSPDILRRRSTDKDKTELWISFHKSRTSETSSYQFTSRFRLQIVYLHQSAIESCYPVGGSPIYRSNASL